MVQLQSKEIFKEKFENGEFDKLLKDVKSPKDVVKIANNLGYELSEADISSAELNDDQLLSVAGGKNDKIYNNYNIVSDSYNPSVDQSMTHNGTGNQGKA